MATVKVAYAGASALTITLASLASDTSLVAGRQSTVVDNTSNLYVDAIIGGKVKLGTTPTAGSVEVWAFGSYDGTSYGGGAGASDANFTPEASSKNAMRLLCVLQGNTTTGQVLTFGGYSLAAVFGGVMPSKWGIWIVQGTAVAFDSTGGNHEVKYNGVSYTVV